MPGRTWTATFAFVIAGGDAGDAFDAHVRDVPVCDQACTIIGVICISSPA
jgi:hypothetical protein